MIRVLPVTQKDRVRDNPTRLDVLPVGPPPGVHEVVVDVVFLVREVRLRGDVDHPRASVAADPQVQAVEAGPVVVFFPVERRLEGEEIGEHRAGASF